MYDESAEIRGKAKIAALEDKFLNKALQRGKLGLAIVKSIYDNKETFPVDLDSSEEAQLLFADLVDLMDEYKIYDYVKDNSKFSFYKWRAHADVYELYRAIKSLSWVEMLKNESDAFVDKLKNRKLFSIWAALESMASGTYVLSSWAQNRHSDDLADDIVNLNTNLGVIGALIITMAFPMYLGADYDGTWCASFYILLCGMCGVFESISVLLCVRNLMVVRLVDPENMHNFVFLGSDYLIAPIKFNFFAILAWMLALAVFAFWQYSYYVGYVFVFGLVVPSIIVFLYCTAAGIKALYEVQPWDEKDLNEMNHVLSESIKINKQKSEKSTKSTSGGRISDSAKVVPDNECDDFGAAISGKDEKYLLK